MLATYADVERTLTRFNDFVRPTGGSVVTISGSSGSSSDRFPFHASLLDDLDARAELRARMAWLTHEEQLVLLHWYIEGLAPAAIARHIRRSPRHVYRVRNAAIRRIVALGQPLEEWADADVSEFV
ncbi:MAG: hypothetical protein JWO37_34 [Acidimicrobiales bacterium]|nr:hypothetical protein [Acidimicrobiales bacterium]